MLSDELFTNGYVDVRSTVLDDNPLAGLPIWTSGLKEFDQHCQDLGFYMQFSFNLLFYGDWDTILSEDRVYKIIADAVRILDTTRVPHTEICISWRPNVRDYKVLTDRFDDLSPKKPYVEGVNLTMGADFRKRGEQFLRLLYGYLQLARWQYFKRYYPEESMRQNGGINQNLFFSFLNDFQSGGKRYSKSIELWKFYDQFYIVEKREQGIPSPEYQNEQYWKEMENFASFIGDPTHRKTKKFITRKYHQFCEKYFQENKKQNE